MRVAGHRDLACRRGDPPASAPRERAPPTPGPPRLRTGPAPRRSPSRAPQPLTAPLRQREENSTPCNPTSTSPSATTRNMASSPPTPPPCPRTSLTGSWSAKRSSPSLVNQGCTGSASPSATVPAGPARPSTIFAARATPCRPTFASTRPSPPAHPTQAGRTDSWSDVAVSPKPPPAERLSVAPHHPPPPHQRPGRSRRSPLTHRPSTCWPRAADSPDDTCQHPGPGDPLPVAPELATKVRDFRLRIAVIDRETEIALDLTRNRCGRTVHADAAAAARAHRDQAALETSFVVQPRTVDVLEAPGPPRLRPTPTAFPPPPVGDPPCPKHQQSRS